MTLYSSRNLLEAWESAWGKLPDKWKSDFLNHPAIPELLYYPNDWIEIAILKNKKLANALKYLAENENEIEPREYRPEIRETDDMINRLTKSIGNQPSSPIPENDWWRDQL